MDPPSKIISASGSRECREDTDCWWTLAWEGAALGVNTRESTCTDGVADERPKVDWAGDAAGGDAASGGAARAAPPAIIAGATVSMRWTW